MSTVAARRSARGGLVRGQLVVLAALITLAAVAWLITDLRAAGMEAGPGGDPGAFGFYLTTWVVMMTAMMFPSIGPMVLTYRNLQVGRRAKGRPGASGSTALFVAGYLLLWAAIGAVAYAVLEAGRAVDGGLLAWHNGGRWLVVGLLLTASAYEFTPLKNACLARCRSPLGFLMGSWLDGRAGALQMGVAHGAWCLGCCWLLMVVLFALGAMSITWMILVAVLIAAEKLLPRPAVGTAGVAALLVALAVGVVAAPRDVPSLTIPGSMHAMGAMHRSTDAMGAMHRSADAMHRSTGGAMHGPMDAIAR